MIKTAVILAAGRGTRLRPYTHDIPKGFMQVGDERLVERSVRLLKENGIETVIIGTGHLKEHYESFARAEGLKTFVNPDFSSTGSFHTLCMGKEFIQDDFLLLESDLLYHEKAISHLQSIPEKDVMLCSGFTQSNDEVYVQINDGQLAILSKKKEELNSVDAELVGIWKVSQVLYQKLLHYHQTAEDALSIDYEKAISNLSGQYPVKVEIIKDLVWCEIDNEEHLARANKEILPGL